MTQALKDSLFRLRQKTDNLFQENSSTGNILIISDSLPDRNGVGSYYRDLMDQLRDHQHAVTLHCPCADKKTWLRFPLPGDATQNIWLPSPAKFYRLFREIRPTTVVVATPGPYGILGALLAKQYRCQLIVGFHTHYSGVTDLYHNRLLRGFSRFYFDIANKIQFKFGDLVLANSDGMRNLAEELGARATGIMGTLLPEDALHLPVTPLRTTPKRILFAGRLSPEKRIDLILDTAARFPDLEFIIVGDGPLRKEVAHADQRLDNVTYMGWLPRQKLLEEMDNSDLLILPSKLEAFGTVALEAMARQRLVIVSDACGIVDWPELARHLYQFSKPDELPQLLNDILTSPAETLAGRALAARQAACQLNHRSLDLWLQTVHIDQPESAYQRV